MKLPVVTPTRGIKQVGCIKRLPQKTWEFIIIYDLIGKFVGSKHMARLTGKIRAP